MKQITDITKLIEVFKTEAEKLVKKYIDLNETEVSDNDKRKLAILSAIDSLYLVCSSETEKKIEGAVFDSGDLIGMFSMNMAEFYSHVGQELHLMNERTWFSTRTIDITYLNRYFRGEFTFSEPYYRLGTKYVRVKEIESGSEVSITYDTIEDINMRYRASIITGNAIPLVYEKESNVFVDILENWLRNECFPRENRE